VPGADVGHRPGGGCVGDSDGEIGCDEWLQKATNFGSGEAIAANEYVNELGQIDRRDTYVSGS
jgi:hypothetical protein